MPNDAKVIKISYFIHCYSSVVQQRICFNTFLLSISNFFLYRIIYYAEHYSSSCRISNGTRPPHRSILHFCDVVFGRSLLEMCAARHDMVEIAVFALPVAPQVFRCRGGGLSRAHSVGRPPFTPWSIINSDVYKILEKIVCNRLLHFLETINILYKQEKSQHYPSYHSPIKRHC